MKIRKTRSVEDMGDRGPKPEDYARKAAVACLTAAFRERVERDFSGATTDKHDKGWQRELERRTGISQSIISQLFNGKDKDYRLGTLLRVRAYIGRELDDLLGLPRLVKSDSVPPPSPAQTPPSSGHNVVRLKGRQRHK